MVEDEVAETGPLPLIFLSYQWDIQNEVKLLKQHLEWAGYRCWMDIGQMGGGNKLFEKIDAGMRAAKVILCCMTNKYPQSDNCTREVRYDFTGFPPTGKVREFEYVWKIRESRGILIKVREFYKCARYFAYAAPP